MIDQSTTEEIPSNLVINALQERLHSCTSELILSNARIAARDATIFSLRQELADAQRRMSNHLGDGCAAPE